MCGACGPLFSHFFVIDPGVQFFYDLVHSYQVAIGSKFLFEDSIKATNDSDNSPTVLKPIKTVQPFSSTPKLESCMSDWVNMRRSPLTLAGNAFFQAAPESKPYAWPR